MKKALANMFTMLGAVILVVAGIPQAFSQDCWPHQNVPEPGTLAIVGATLIGGIVARRFFKR